MRYNYISRSQFIFLFSLAALFGFFLGVYISRIHSQHNELNIKFFNNRSLLDKLVKTEDFLSNNFLGEFKSLKQVENSLISAYVSLLGDPYSFFLDSHDAEKYLETLSGDYHGIGVVLDWNNDRLQYPKTYISSIVDGGAASRVDKIAPGTYVIAVDDIDVRNKLPYEVSSLIRGEAGTEVRLVLLSSNEEKYEIKLIREKITIPKIIIELDKFDKVDYVKITDFVDTSLDGYLKNIRDKFSVLLEQNNRSRTKSLYLDLRGNSGGYVQGAVVVADYFLDKGSVITSERNSKNQITNVIYSTLPKVVDYKKIYILVDRGTASAAEILTLSLKENLTNVIIVGESTFGKGSEQTMIKNFLDTGGLLNLTFQNWLSPKGFVLDKNNPIKPDIKIDNVHSDSINSIHTYIENVN